MTEGREGEGRWWGRGTGEGERSVLLRKRGDTLGHGQLRGNPQQCELHPELLVGPGPIGLEPRRHGKDQFNDIKRSINTMAPTAFLRDVVRLG